MKKIIFLILALFSLNSFACGPMSDYFCVGDYARTSNYDVQIVQIYENETARLRFLTDSSSGVFPLSSLIKVREAYDCWKVGMRGLIDNYYVEVVKIYGDGSAKLRFFTDNSLGFFPLSDVSHEVHKINGWKVGQRAIVDRYNVVILKLFENGKARLRFFTDNSEGYFSTRDLSSVPEDKVLSRQTEEILLYSGYLSGGAQVSTGN